MAQLSKAHKEFYARFDGQKELTCTECGVSKVYYNVTPQYDHYRKTGEIVLLCGECVNAHNERVRSEMAAARAAAPRCEVPGCKGAQAGSLAGRLAVCGKHSKKIQAEFQKSQSRGGFLTMGAQAIPSREAMLEMAGR